MGGKDATIIYNPIAGPANLATVMALVADMWRARGWRVLVTPTRAQGHATELARTAAAAGERLVFAAGGDGTLGEVANGLAGTATIMAPLPAGTANSFAKELNMPRPSLVDRLRLLKASDALAAGRVHAMDLGFTYLGDRETGHGRYWLLWVGVGADGYLVEELEPRPKWSKTLGPLGYALQGAAAVTGYSHIAARVRVDGQTISDDFILILISNCRRYAGGEMLLSPAAFLDDGLFEVWLFRGKGLSHTAQHVLNVMLERHLRHPDVSLLHGRTVTVHTDTAVPCQTDGEPAGQTPLLCEIKPGALRLLVPNTAPGDLFTHPGEPLDER